MNRGANEHCLRREKLRKKLAQKKVDGFVTFDFFDVLYLTGFPSEGCFLLLSQAGDFLFAPLLLGEHARSTVREDRELQVISDQRLRKEFQSILIKNGLRKMAYDRTRITLLLYQELSRLEKARWTSLDAFALSQRMLKDESEVAAISKACAIAYRSWEIVLKKLKGGESEKEVAFSLEEGFHRLGAQKIAFETIVAFGENAAFPHHVASDRQLQQNSAVLMDLGCVVNGYRSDLTRTSVFGKIDGKFKKVYALVKRAQQEGIESVRDGVSAQRVDFVCREVIRKAGYGDYFIHGTGHGVGLEIHEPPRLGMNTKEILKAGMVVTVEPGIYLPGEFGVRIEDTVLVTKNGCRILTQ